MTPDKFGGITLQDRTELASHEAMLIAKALKKARKNKGLTQQEAADACRLTLDAYKRCEGGKHVPRAERIAALAQGLGISTDELVLETDQRSISEELRALFNAVDKLPDEKKSQIKMAIKGMLLAYAQDELR